MARKKKRKRLSAEDMGKRQKSISISEFFSKNRHLLGFDNPKRALLTSVKEAVDNSLDACEEGGILPSLSIEVVQKKDNRFEMTVEDNGPGIVKKQIPSIFAKLLYGSKFHRLKMSRGQQGIGISAAGMYGQLTTGNPVRILSQVARSKKAHVYELLIDTVKNKPKIIEEDEIPWEGKKHGVRITITLEGYYQKGSQSLDEYVKQTAIANPHAEIRYKNPLNEETVYERTVNDLPDEPDEIKPHPYGVELGMLMKILANSSATRIRSSLQKDFSRVSGRVANEICEKAGVNQRAYTQRIAKNEVEAIYKAIQETKIMAPPTSCIVPIGEDVILEGLKKEIDAEFFTSCTRKPSVYRGNPFCVEAGLAYGGELPAEEPAAVMRFANRVPLLYQRGGCAVTEAVQNTNWRNYGIKGGSGSYPVGPLAVFIHIASVWVPFTSESKEAIAHYPEIITEIKYALQQCGRDAATFIRKKRRARESERKRKYIEQYIPHIGIALRQILDLNDREERKIVKKIQSTLQRRKTDGKG